MKKVIIVADDVRQNRDILCEIIGAMHEGFSTLEARDGRQALELLATNRDRVCAVLTDFEMPPGMDGGKLLSQIRVTDPDLPVIMISGLPHSTLLAEGVLRPDDMFIPKPVLPAELQATVRIALGLA